MDDSSSLGADALSLSSGGRSLEGYFYQLDVSILTVLDLVLARKVAREIVLEPATEEDLEADIEDEPGALSEAVSLDGYRLVLQCKLRNTGPWKHEDLSRLLAHGKRRKAARERLADSGIRYLLVTSADLDGVARQLKVETIGLWPPVNDLPADMAKNLPANAGGRIAILGAMDQEKVNARTERLLSQRFRVPHSNLQTCRETLRSEALLRMRERRAQPKRSSLTCATRYPASDMSSSRAAPMTRRCDWRIRDLIEDERPTTLYLVVPPSDISRTKPLVRLILNQIGRRLTEDLHAKGRRHRLLFMLDEFPALGRLDFFESALAFMAGYGLKSFLIAQSLNQIEKAYGPNNAILDNCHVRVSFATNDERTAKRVSDALGTATELRAMKNYAGHRLNPWLGHLMVSRQETARPLLTPGEVMQLPPNDELVLVSGVPPIHAKKARYFEDPRLTERVLPPPRSGPLDREDSAPTDDWSRLSAPANRGVSKPVSASGARPPVDDPANSGIRREPALPRHEDSYRKLRSLRPSSTFQKKGTTVMLSELARCDAYPERWFEGWASFRIPKKMGSAFANERAR